MQTSPRDFSQFGEQQLILSYFGSFTGAFLSIGENDGETFSNVRALALAGWRGACIEPSPAAYARLAALYDQHPTIRTYNVAITTTDCGNVPFWENETHLNAGDVGLLSTTIHSELAKWVKYGNKFREIRVPAMSFHSWLSWGGPSKFEPKRFDFITIDAEGADFSILTQINPVELGCRLLCVEVGELDPAPFDIYLASFGMRVRAVTTSNRFYSSPG